MLPYWLLFAVYASGSFATRRGAFEGRQVTPLFVAAGLFTALMIGLRSHVGGDWSAYVNMFQKFSLLNLDQTIYLSDPGYAVLNWMIAWLGGGLWLVNLLGGLIFAYGLGRFSREQPNPWLTALVAVPYLVIVVAMGYTRQGIAIGLIMVALSARNRKSVVRFLFFTVVAAAFHKSAIIVIPMLALTQTRSRLSTTAVLIVTAAIIYYLLIAGATDALMRNYIDEQYSSAGAYIRVPMNLVPGLIFLFNYRKFMMNEATRKLWRNFSLGAVVALVLLVTTPSSTAVDRISLYLIPLQMLVLGRLPYVVTTKRDSNILFVMVIVYSAAIQFVWLNNADNRGSWLPYRFYVPGFGEV